MSHHVLMFQPQFARLVENGTKTMTIRGEKKRAIQVGDTLSLREWLGKPYRSKQSELRKAVVTCIGRFEMRIGSPIGAFPWNVEFLINGFVLLPFPSIELAHADGFWSRGDMVRWFDETHGLPFSGVRISWGLAQ